MYSCGSNAGMETSAPLFNAIVNNAVFHSNSHIKQMLPQVIHILRFCLVDSLPHILVLRLGLFNGQKSGSL